MGRKLRFGGEGLPEGTHTWYETPKGGMYQANPGDVVDADRVLRVDEYVARGQAQFVENGGQRKK